MLTIVAIAIAYYSPYGYNGYNGYAPRRSNRYSHAPARYYGRKAQHYRSVKSPRYSTLLESPKTATNPYNIHQSKAIERCVKKNQIAFSLAGGPTNAVTPESIMKLKELNVPATYFQIDNSLKQESNSVNLMNDALKERPDLFTVGIHGWEDDSTNELFRPHTAGELQKLAQTSMDLMYNAYGKKVRYYRPKHGKFDNSSLSVWNDMGLIVINWSINSYDWKYPHNATAVTIEIQKNMDRDGPQSSHIMLCHDFERICTVDMITTVVSDFKAKGYTFVSMEECLGGIKPYRQ